MPDKKKPKLSRKEKKLEIAERKARSRQYDGEKWIITVQRGEREEKCSVISTGDDPLLREVGFHATKLAEKIYREECPEFFAWIEKLKDARLQRYQAAKKAELGRRAY